MNLVGHLFEQHAVNEPLGLEFAESLETRRNDDRSKMTAPRAGASMARVKMAFIQNFEMNRLKRPCKLLFDPSSSIH